MSEENSMTFEQLLSEDAGSPWEFLGDEASLDIGGPTPTPPSTPPIEEEEEDVKKDKPEFTVSSEEDITFEDAFGEKDEEESSNEEQEEEQEEETATGTFDPFINHLAERGIVSKIEGMESVDTEEDFEKVIRGTIDQEVEAYKNSFSEQSRNFMEFLENGGDPQVFINTYVENTTETSNQSDADVVKEYYTDKGLSEKRIKSLIEDLEDSDEIEEEAKIARAYFDKREKMQLGLLLKLRNRTR